MGTLLDSEWKAVVRVLSIQRFEGAAPFCLWRLWALGEKILEAEVSASRAQRAAKAAATKVDFFTMVRGED